LVFLYISSWYKYLYIAQNIDNLKYNGIHHIIVMNIKLKCSSLDIKQQSINLLNYVPTVWRFLCFILVHIICSSREYVILGYSVDLHHYFNISMRLLIYWNVSYYVPQQKKVEQSKDKLYTYFFVRCLLLYPNRSFTRISFLTWILLTHPI
jgi:hypothetical protein